MLIVLFKSFHLRYCLFKSNKVKKSVLNWVYSTKIRKGQFRNNVK